MVACPELRLPGFPREGWRGLEVRSQIYTVVHGGDGQRRQPGQVSEYKL